MYSNSSILIFTDLDGTLLNRDTFKFDSIKPFLKELKNKNIIIIPNSSKTEDEIIEFNNEADFQFPFVSENGSIIHNLNFLNHEFPDKIMLARNTHKIKNIFDKNIHQDLKSKCKVISSLTISEQTQIFGLPENKLKQVFKRSDAMKKIIQMLEAKFKCKPKIIAVGDNHNDLEMLQNSDIPCLVKNDKFLKKNLKIKNLIISKQAAPEGWVEIVKLALEKIKLKE